MNPLLRRIRRKWYQHRCEACGRRYMFTHAKCPKFPKTLDAAQDEINAIRNQRVDAVAITQGLNKIDPCCGQCTDIDKEIANDR